MVTRRLNIVEKAREHPVRVVDPQDFVAVAGEEISVAEVIADPKFSLYCFDMANETALFVECDDPLAVDNAPFYYQAQYNHAVGLVSMPLAHFQAAAPSIPNKTTQVVFVHSVGRCGSTLVSKILQGIPSVHSLSEPDDYTQLCRFRTQFGHPEELIEDMMVASANWRCKPRLGQEFKTVAIKTRSEVLVLADLFAKHFKQHKHMFLYREGVSWTRSVIQNWPSERDIHDVENNRLMRDGWADTLPLAREYQLQEIDLNAIEVRILAWITCMEAYLNLEKSGVPICAARFEDLIAHPGPVIHQLLSFCGIDGVDRQVMQEILDRDSQAGTVFDREERKKRVRELTDDNIQDVIDMVAGRPLLGGPNVCLPGTVQI
jgi:hypothetical protein